MSITKKKWTPGPWTVVRQDDDSGDIWYDIWSPGESQSVAHVAEMAREGTHRGRTKNDAQIIASCPDVLEALLGLRKYTFAGGCWCDAFDNKGLALHAVSCLRARAAIATLLSTKQPQE